MLFVEAVERYIKHQLRAGRQGTSYERLDGYWKRALGEMPVSEITTEVIEDLLEKGMNQGWSNGTRNNALREISGFLSFAVQRKWIGEHPVKGMIPILPAANPRTRWLQPSELEELKSHCPPWLRVIIDGAVRTGLRLSNLCNLKVSDYFTDAMGNAFLVVDRTKNGDRHYVPITGSLRNIVEYRVQHAPSPDQLIFPGPYGGKAMSSIRRYLPEAVRKSGMTWGRDFENGVVFHTLRHSFASLAFQAGLRESEVMALGGWKTREVLKRYLHLAPETLVDAAEKINRKIGGK